MQTELNRFNQMIHNYKNLGGVGEIYANHNQNNFSRSKTVNEKED